MEVNFEICRYAQDKNQNSHFHESYEILISLNNEGKFFVREKGYQLHFGMVFILNQFELHRCFCHVRFAGVFSFHFAKNVLLPVAPAAIAGDEARYAEVKRLLVYHPSNV